MNIQSIWSAGSIVLAACCLISLAMARAFVRQGSQPGGRLLLLLFAALGGAYFCYAIEALRRTLDVPPALNGWSTAVRLALPFDGGDGVWRAALGIGSLALILPSVAGLVYLQTRAAFFDVLLKHSAAIALLALLAILAAVPLGAVTAICGMLFLLAWEWLELRLDSVLDRRIFGRLDHRRALRDIRSAVARAQTAEEAVEAVTGGLKAAFRANWVRVSDRVEPDAEAAASMGVPGTVSCGPRWRGRPYQSADLALLASTGRTLAAALEGLATADMRRAAAANENAALRAQINPKFLFRSLESIGDLVADSPPVRMAVSNLGQVFRYALDATGAPAVRLGDELDFMRSYLELERMRFEERLRFEIETEDGMRDLGVPSMLIQPLVENAIKHGISPLVEGGVVRVRASRGDGRALVRVEDTGTGFDPGSVEFHVGVQNVRNRVLALPGGKMTIDSAPGRGTRIDLAWTLEGAPVTRDFAPVTRVPV